MLTKHSSLSPITKISQISYRTINSKNFKNLDTSQNKKNSQIFKNMFPDEDDTKNNKNFKNFMDSLLEKEKTDDNTDISNIHSNNIFLNKNPKNNKFFSVQLCKHRNIFISNDIERKSIGLECKIADYLKYKKDRNNKNCLLRNRQNMFFSNSTNCKNSQTFSLREFDGKMLRITKKLTYSQKIEKIQKKKKNNSYNYIRKILPKNIMQNILFPPKTDERREKENKLKLTNAILFLKDKNSKNNKNGETKSLINYNYMNEKKNLMFNRLKNNNNNIYYPSIKSQIFYGNRNLKFRNGINLDMNRKINDYYYINKYPYNIYK